VQATFGAGTVSRWAPPAVREAVLLVLKHGRRRQRSASTASRARQFTNLAWLEFEPYRSTSWRGQHPDGMSF